MLRLIQGDCLEILPTLPDCSVHTCVTSPPYFGLRDYGVAGQHGMEETPNEFVEKMVLVFREVRRVLRDDGTLWLNLGDSYAGSWGAQSKPVGHFSQSVISARHIAAGAKKKSHAGTIKQAGLKPKDLMGIPWRVAFALQDDGWWLRQDIIWHKKNPMPESIKDRCTKAHEYIFLLSKSERYYFDQNAILEPCSPNTHARLSQDVQNQIGSERANGGAKTNGNMKAVGRKFDPGASNKNNPSFDSAMAIMPEKRNKRSVWEVATQPYSGAHFATFPPKLIEPCILAGSPVGGTVLDPYNGSGTTGQVSLINNRKYIGLELNPDYIKLSRKRLSNLQPVLNFA